MDKFAAAHCQKDAMDLCHLVDLFDTHRKTLILEKCFTPVTLWKAMHHAKGCINELANADGIQDTVSMELEIRKDECPEVADGRSSMETDGRTALSGIDTQLRALELKSGQRAQELETEKGHSAVCMGETLRGEVCAVCAARWRDVAFTVSRGSSCARQGRGAHRVQHDAFAKHEMRRQGRAQAASARA